ncbi:MAG: 1-acyl-sn-glycerol-3-phosphate acyltransferase [Saprospiraceae bacterium]|nr:1-acyl-sn-glycerol-3-phosphate acyltransferase [Saprospiraceae bacterium]
MNPILKLFYRFLQALAVVSLNIYFRKVVFVNRKNLTAKGPLMVVSNHMNTGLDPLFTLMYAREQCFLLVNYSLFKNPISRAILSTLYCIPIQRIQDIPAGQTPKNEDAFRACDTHLKAGRSIYVAPEGTSYAERHIRECKTGTARIVFSAESQNDFALDLRILPVGITYYDALKFGTDVVVEVGEPFSADNYAALYADNPRQAVQQLTEDIEHQFIKLTVHCKDAAEDAFLKKLEILLTNDAPLDVEAHHRRSKRLIADLHDWQATHLAAFESFKNKVEAYFDTLDRLKIKDYAAKTTNLPLSILGMVVALPAFLVGCLGNLIPAWLSDRMIKVAKVDDAYDSTIRFCAGLVFFPLYWWILAELVFGRYDLNFFETLAYTLVMIGTGLLSWRVYTEGAKVWNYFRYQKANRDGQLTALRQPIIEALNRFDIHI